MGLVMPHIAFLSFLERLRVLVNNGKPRLYGVHQANILHASRIERRTSHVAAHETAHECHGSQVGPNMQKALFHHNQSVSSQFVEEITCTDSSKQIKDKTRKIKVNGNFPYSTI
jgi:hypothetical protein